MPWRPTKRIIPGKEDLDDRRKEECKDLLLRTRYEHFKTYTDGNYYIEKGEAPLLEAMTAMNSQWIQYCSRWGISGKFRNKSVPGRGFPECVKTVG